MFCPRCGAESPEEAAFCISCGASTKEAAAQAPPVPSAASSAPSKCPECGNANTDSGAIYCASCGAGLATTAGSPGYGLAAPGSRGDRRCRSCHRLAPREASVCPHCGGVVVGTGSTGGLVVAVVLGLLVVMVGGGAVMAAILVPNFIRARAQGQVTACKSNLKNIGTALEMWSTDHEGYYPESLGELTPDYLKFIPTCPSAGVDTYSAAYRSAPRTEATPDEFLVVCSGHNHEGIAGPGYPQYSSQVGLIER